MTKSQYNAAIAQEIGAMNGIQEITAACDKPCSAHDSLVKVGKHKQKVIELMATYTGNGMGDDIAEKVAGAVKAAVASLPVPPAPAGANVTFTLPGTDKIISVGKTAVSTWGFRLIVMPLIVYWLSNGKIDREVVREVVADAVKEHREQLQPLNRPRGAEGTEIPGK